MFDKLLIHRSQQLQNEKSIDEKLESMSMMCPEIVIQYLLRQREINRNYVLNLKNDSVLKYYSNIQKNLNDIDKEQTFMINNMNVHSPYHSCNLLEIHLDTPLNKGEKMI